MFLNRNLLSISHFFLFSLILSINVNGADFFSTKELFFFLFVITSFQYCSYQKIWYLLLCMAIYFFSASMNMCFHSNLDFFQGLKYSMGFVYLYLIVSENKIYAETIKNAFLISSVIVSSMIIFVWCFCKLFPNYGFMLTNFFDSIKTDKNAFVFMIRPRKFLKWWIFGVYYCTAPSMIPALAYFLYLNYKKTTRKNTIFSLMLFFALIFTGARANIVAGLGLQLMYICLKLIKNKKEFLAVLLILVSIAFMLVLVALLLGDKKEASLATKTLHKISYEELFDSDYLRSLFYGWGAGSYFLSKGYGYSAQLTELTIWETIRRYGFFSALIMFVVLWGSPIFDVLCTNQTFWIKLYFSISIGLYVFVGCTNPFLFGSIGFCTLLFFRTIVSYYLI